MRALVLLPIKEPPNGPAVIRTTDMTTESIWLLHKAGRTYAQIGEAFPDLTVRSIVAALAYEQGRCSELRADLTAYTRRECLECKGVFYTPTGEDPQHVHHGGRGTYVFCSGNCHGEWLGATERCHEVDTLRERVAELERGAAADEVFATTVCDAVENHGLDKVQQRIGCSRASVRRWAAGTSAPHQAMRELVYRAIAALAEETEKP